MRCRTVLRRAHRHTGRAVLKDKRNDERERLRCVGCGSKKTIYGDFVLARNGGRLCIDCADTFAWYAERLREEREARRTRQRRPI